MAQTGRCAASRSHSSSSRCSEVVLTESRARRSLPVSRLGSVAALAGIGPLAGTAVEAVPSLEQETRDPARHALGERCDAAEVSARRGLVHPRFGGGLHRPAATPRSSAEGVTSPRVDSFDRRPRWSPVRCTPLTSTSASLSPVRCETSSFHRQRARRTCDDVALGDRARGAPAATSLMAHSGDAGGTARDDGAPERCSRLAGASRPR